MWIDEIIDDDAPNGWPVIGSSAVPLGLAQRKDLPLRRAPKHRVLRLRRGKAGDIGHRQRRFDLFGRLFQKPIAHFAQSHGIGERAQCVSDWHVQIEAMYLVKVDVIGPELPE